MPLLRAVPADLSMVPYMAAHARREDRVEWFLGTYRKLDRALQAGLEIPGSVNRAVVGEDGNPLILFGAHPYLAPGAGQAWLVATDAALTQIHALHRFFKAELAELEAPFGHLVAFSHVGNSVHHRWMRWVGFRSLGPMAGQPFLIFIKDKTSPCVGPQSSEAS